MSDNGQRNNMKLPCLTFGGMIVALIILSFIVGILLTTGVYVIDSSTGSITTKKGNNIPALKWIPVILSGWFVLSILASSAGLCGKYFTSMGLQSSKSPYIVRI